jgi:hypothetical protein
MTIGGAIRRFAETATPLRLALLLVAVLAAALVNGLANSAVEQALRAHDCGFLECLRPLRPEGRHEGYSAAEFRSFLDHIGPLRGTALKALVTDLPLTIALVAALVTGSSLATRGLPLSDRTRGLLIALPFGFALADIVEDILLALAYSGLADTSAVVPWATSLKFALVAASFLSSLVLGAANWAMGRSAE